MRVNLLKSGLLIALLSVLLAACTSTSTEEDTAATATTLPEDNVATGTVTDTDVSGSMLDETVDTVFYFDFDKAVLKPEARAALSVHAQSLRANPQNIRLEGHADERGTREYNMALGERRANSVKEFLVLQGVSPSVIEVISYGEERPAALGSDEESWGLNRRVEMK